MKIEQ